MKIGERGQVTIPKEIRDRFGIGPESEVEFAVVRGEIVVKKKPRKLDVAKVAARFRKRLAPLGYKTTDEFIEAIRGR